MGLTERIAVVLVAEVLIKCVSGFVLVLLGMGSVGALLGNLLGAVVPFASLPMYARFIGRPTWRLGDKNLWRAAGRISGLQGAVGAASTVDAILVAATPATAAGAAAYQAAATLGKIPLYLSTAMGTAAFPLLGREGGRRVYAHTVAAYLYLGLFCVAALVTVPRELMLFLFNDNFADTVRWLPPTAALGVLIGLFNILMTCDQAHELSRRAVLKRLAGAVMIALATAVGAREWGIHGMVIAACGALAVVMILVGGTSIQRGGLIDAVKNLVLSGKILVLAPTYVLLRAVSAPIGWLVCSAGLGVLSLLIAFPELRPAFLQRHRRRRVYAGSRRAD
jgi:O-antigen/teichoic acid export membrane protein